MTDVIEVRLSEPRSIAGEVRRGSSALGVLRPATGLSASDVRNALALRVAHFASTGSAIELRMNEDRGFGAEQKRYGDVIATLEIAESYPLDEVLLALKLWQFELTVVVEAV